MTPRFGKLNEHVAAAEVQQPVAANRRPPLALWRTRLRARVFNRGLRTRRHWRHNWELRLPKPQDSTLLEVQ